AGFTHTEEEGLVTATGQDPNLRIIMAMDPLYAVPANALFAEVRAQIDSDETLSNPHEANGRLTYLEHPGDDSEVTWTTWVEDDQQVSLGCHTRKAPSMAQRAACRMASESIEKVS
ncbi:MAG: type VII secretion-associated protein, partial [Corynebacterium casei]